MKEITLADKVTDLAKRIFCNDCGASDTCDMHVESKCPNAYSELLTAAKVGGEHAKEKAIDAFCNIMTHESLKCALSRKIGMSCRDECLMYKEFINEACN